MNHNREVGTGMALSGGGFRATLFHLGALWRLNEMAMLPELEAVSSVSGGSLLAGLLATRWWKLRFTNGVADNFEEEIVKPVLRFCGKNIDVPSVLWRDCHRNKDAGGVLRKASCRQSDATGPSGLSEVHFQRLSLGNRPQLDFCER